MNARYDGPGREVPGRMDTGNDGAPLRRGERAGSPSPTALENRDAAGSWQDIKGRFVDDPAGAIKAAEELVRLALEQRIRALKDEAAALCAEASDQDASSTEGLRTRLIRYQQYCERLAETAMH
jgi:hypothetical protein